MPWGPDMPQRRSHAWNFIAKHGIGNDGIATTVFLGHHPDLLAPRGIAWVPGGAGAAAISRPIRSR